MIPLNPRLHPRLHPRNRPIRKRSVSTPLPQKPRAKMRYPQRKKSYMGKRGKVVVDSDLEQTTSPEDAGKQTRDSLAKKQGTAAENARVQEQAGLDIRVRQLRTKIRVNYQESMSEQTNSGFNTSTTEEDQDWVSKFLSKQQEVRFVYLGSIYSRLFCIAEIS